MEKWLNYSFSFLFCVIVGTGIGIVIGGTVSISSVDSRVQSLQKERDTLVSEAYQKSLGCTREQSQTQE